jgi:hypothetical protein
VLRAQASKRIRSQRFERKLVADDWRRAPRQPAKAV